LLSDWLVDEPDCADVVDVDDVDDVVVEVEDAEAVEDVPVAVLAPVVALLLSEVSVTVNELSRELITATLLLLIRVVPSLGRVVVGTGVSLAVVVLAAPVEVDAVVLEDVPLAVEVDDVLEVDVEAVDEVVVVVDVVVVPVVVVTEKPGTTFRLGVK
jgi:hypothetical protein